MKVRDRATRGSEQSGCLKIPRVGWDFRAFWGLEWEFFALGPTSSPTREVGFSPNSREKWDFLLKPSFIFVFTVYFIC
jgi:hypothetical protein